MDINGEPFAGTTPKEIARPPTLSFIFQHEGRFLEGQRIIRGFNVGEETILVIDKESSDELLPAYNEAIKKHETGLPQQEVFPNGLSREQATEVLAAQEVIVNFNGGFINEHSFSRNIAFYKERKGQVDLSSLKNKGALMCVEFAVLSQQLLSSSQKMTYVSGSADIENSGRFEMHSFNIIKPADNKYAAAILDFTNPIYVRQEDGTTQVRLYCAPISQEQLTEFNNGETIEVEYGEIRRKYKFGSPGGLKIIT